MHEHQSIALLPGSFKPPHKGHWAMIEQARELADEVHVFISNASETYIRQRPISKSNFAKYLKYLKKSNLHNAAYIMENYNKVPYKDLELDLQTALPEELFTELKQTLFKSVRYTANGKAIEPQIAEEIFKLYIQDYKYNNVILHVCDNPSPITAAIGYVNHKCKDCTIFLASKTKDESVVRGEAWNNSLRGVDINNHNTINILPDAEKIQAARDIRKNINNLTKDMFPEKISMETFEKIKMLLEK